MKRGSFRRLALALLIAGMTLLSGPAMSERGRDRWRDVEPHSYAPGSSADRRITLNEAVERVQRRTGGRVLDARDLGDAYRLKVLTRNGEVRVIFVDAATGSFR